MEEIIERIKNNRLAQIALVAVILVLVFSFYVLYKISSSSKKSKLPCYNETIKILSPFSEEKFYEIKKLFAPYCIKIEVTKKSIEYIRENLLREIAEGKIPDLVYIDNDFIENNKNIFKEYDGDKIKKENFSETSLILSNNKLLNYPVSFDTLVMFSNEKYLNILGIINPPNTFDELLNIVKTAKNNPFLKNVIPIALGTTDNIVDFYEIFLTIHKNLNPSSYKDAEGFYKTFDFYTQFADKTSNLYSWDSSFSSSLEKFGEGNVLFAFGFYSDSNKIQEINNRLKFRITEFPKFSNFNQTNYLKIYSFAVPVQGKYKFAWKVLEILDDNYEDLIKDLNLLPVRKDIFDKLTGDKRNVAKDLLIGSNFDEFNRDYAEKILRDTINKWLEDKENAKLFFIRGQFYKIFNK